MDRSMNVSLEIKLQSRLPLDKSELLGDLFHTRHEQIHNTFTPFLNCSVTVSHEILTQL